MNNQKYPEYDEQLQETQTLWDNEAPTFDQEADHGLNKPIVRQAWKTLLHKIIDKPKHSKVLDIGCGTGSISILLSEFEYDVTGVDLSPEMIDIARKKAITYAQNIRFHVMDASYPTFDKQNFDIIFCRHLLWALPQPNDVIARWLKLLKPHGQLILIEGFWHTEGSAGSGLHAQEILDILPSNLTNISHQELSTNSELWDKEVSDERYVITATLSKEIGLKNV